MDFRAGETVKVRIQYPTGTDITGYRFILSLKSSMADADASAVLREETTAGDYAADDPETGLAYLVVDAADTLIAIGQYFWDITAVDADGEVLTLLPPATHWDDKIIVAPKATQSVL
jgi:hypothetical protein